MKSVPITVVVPVYNASRRVEPLLESLRNLNPQPQEVILVDDGSADDTLERLHQALQGLPAFKVIGKPNGGPASARNQGVFNASQPWVAFTDDDCLPDTRWLGALQATIEAQPQLLCIFGRIQATGPIGPLHHYVENNGDGHHTANAAYRTETLLGLGGFDERFPYAYLEDTDLFLRVSSQGAWCFCADALVLHPSRPASIWSRVKRMRYLESDYLLYSKHPSVYRKRHRGQAPFTYHLYYLGLKHGLKVTLQALARLAEAPWEAVNVIAGTILERLYLLYLSVGWVRRHKS